MNYSKLIIGLIILCVCVEIQAQQPEWENMSVNQINTENAHASFISYPSSLEAKSGVACSMIKSLNGKQGIC